MNSALAGDRVMTQRVGCGSAAACMSRGSILKTRCECLGDYFSNQAGGVADGCLSKGVSRW